MNSGRKRKASLFGILFSLLCNLQSNQLREVSSRLGVDNKQHPAVADTQKMLMKLPFLFYLLSFISINMFLIFLPFFFTLSQSASLFFSFSFSHSVSTNRAILEAVCSCVNDTSSVNFEPKSIRDRKSTKSQRETDRKPTENPAKSRVQ